MSPKPLPPGFRFHPTDDELVGYYLKRKIEGLNIELEVIPVIDLYKFDPWQLPDKSFMPKRDMEWFFFCPRDRKYPNGSRTNRATASGYWKATGKDRKVICEPSVQALRKTLVFYIGRAPGGERTDWVMHEYRLCEDLSQLAPNFLGAFALCRVVKRNDHGQKIGSKGESRGKRSLPSTANDLSPRKNFSKAMISSEENSCQVSSLFEISIDSTPPTSLSESGGGTETQPISIDADQTGFWGPQYLSDAAKVFSLDEGLIFEPILPTDQFDSSVEGCPPCNISPVSSYASLTDETYFVLDSSVEGCPPCNISPVSSYASLTDETYFVDELNGQEGFAAFPSPPHCMNMRWNGEEMALQSLDWDMASYMYPPINGLEACNTVMCRQASDVEEANLWLLDDSMVSAM